MVKKISIVGGLGLLLSSLALAQKAPSAPSAATILATLDGTASFCSKVNPESEAKHKDIVLALTNGQSEEKIAEIRNSKEYKDRLEQTSKQLGALSPKEASATCKVGK